MSRVLVAVGALATSLLVISCGRAADGTPTLQVRDAWMAQPAGPNASIHLTIANPSGSPDRLLGASAPFAARVELHETVTEGGRTMMRPVGRIPVPAHSTVRLAQGGVHLMLFDVEPGITEGQRLSVRLRFAEAGARSVTVAVRPMGATGAGDTTHHEGHP